MRSTKRCLYFTFLTLLSALSAAKAEDNNGYNGYYGNNNQNNNGGNNYQNGNDYIQYWTDHAVLPKRCIVYNDVDVIVFSVYDKAYNHCQDEPVGTYVTPVTYYVNGLVNQEIQDMQDQGYNYNIPDVAQYLYCTAFEIQNQIFFFQLGCADDSTQKLAVNIYEDNQCTKRSKNADGYDDSNLDVSALGLVFNQCEACVNWFDMDEQADDQYFETHKTQAPLCSTVWSNKQECVGKCRRTGLDAANLKWNTSDKVLLGILSLFALIMVALIVRKRQKMSNKDALLEQAAMSAAGLQQPHIIGVCILVILVIAVFTLLGLKNITWTLLLLVNTALFAYLMKLTVDSGVRAESMIGPDGTIVRHDSDDSSVDDETSSRRTSSAAGLFTLPTLA